MNDYSCLRSVVDDISFCSLLQTEDRGQVEQRPILSQRSDVRAIGFIEALKIPVSAAGMQLDIEAREGYSR